jgi:predicted TIM-barrel fold metal-dependent hydrolase
MESKMDKKSTHRVIALEEHFLYPKILAYYSPSYVSELEILKDKLTDIGPGRIRRMDAAGIDVQVLSHIDPGVQNLETDKAISFSKEINDLLGEAISKYPTRFAGFATLPTQSPGAAADELERTVKQYGFKGAMINGHTQGRYLDDPSFSVLLERAQALNVPIYIHPTDPPGDIKEMYYKGSDILTTGWGWQVETGTHVLRLMVSGVFDRYPRLKIIIGHMGESIPYNLIRINKALSLGEWLIASQTKDAGSSSQKGMQKSVYYYMHENVFITTSGVFDQAALTCAIAEIGIDNILFSADDPFADIMEAKDFLKNANLSSQDKEKLAHQNAERLLIIGDQYRGTPDRSIIPSIRSSIFTYKAQAKSRLARAMLSFLVK